MPKPQTTGRSRTRRTAPAPTGLTRVRMVWVSFLGAMTLVGALLMTLDGRPVPRVDGLVLSPLAAASTITDSSGLDMVRTRTPIQPGRWQAIVIHHSGAGSGSPASIEKEHQDRGFRRLGHHFIIGNGNGMEDGEINVGYRWMEQKPGAHAGGPNGDWYNLNTISICLVGDGNRQPFTRSQVRRLTALVEALRAQLGLPADRVLVYSDIVKGDDPGRLFPAGLFGTTDR